MAVFTMSMALVSGGTLTASVNLTDVNAQRIIAAHRDILGLAPNSTSAAVWSALVQRDFSGIKQNTINYERQQQASAIVVDDIPLI